MHTPPYPGLVLQNSYFPTTYWITAKRPKALAALRRAFPQAEWDVLTTTIDAQIPTEDKLHPAKWLDQLSQHYLSGEPIIQSTHNFLRILKQDPGMTIQAWHTMVCLEYQKCYFPAAVDDRLQRDIFLIGLNDTFKRFRGDVISRENFTTLTFAQVIAKARDLRMASKPNLPSHSTTLKRPQIRLCPPWLNLLRTNNHFVAQDPLLHLLALLVMPSVFGVVEKDILIAVTVLPQMLSVMVAVKKVIRIECGASLLLSKLCLMQTQLVTTNNKMPMSSHMMCIMSNLQQKASLLILTSVPLQNHQHQITSNSKLTLVARVTQYMSQTSTNYTRYKWIPLQFVSATTLRQSSAQMAKPLYTVFTVENRIML